MQTRSKYDFAAMAARFRRACSVGEGGAESDARVRLRRSGEGLPELAPKTSRSTTMLQSPFNSRISQWITTLLCPRARPASHSHVIRLNSHGLTRCRSCPPVTSPHRPRRTCKVRHPSRQMLAMLTFHKEHGAMLPQNHPVSTHQCLKAPASTNSMLVSKICSPPTVRNLRQSFSTLTGHGMTNISPIQSRGSSVRVGEQFGDDAVFDGMDGLTTHGCTAAECTRTSSPSGSDKEKPMCFEHGCSGRVFSSWSNLRRHQRERSRQASQCFCPRCGAHFSRTTARKQHIANASYPPKFRQDYHPDDSTRTNDRTKGEARMLHPATLRLFKEVSFMSSAKQNASCESHIALRERKNYHVSLFIVRLAERWDSQGIPRSSKEYGESA
nr:hypothetical protein CFP56_22031 [Quercus suber]